jgi:hypothetical protein
MKLKLQSFLAFSLLLAALPAVAQNQDTDTENGHEVKARQVIAHCGNSAAG